MLASAAGIDWPPARRSRPSPTAAASVVVLHASDSPSVFLQARARMTASSPAEIERELYEDRTVLRVLAMRRTLFLVPVADVPMIHAAASRAVAADRAQADHRDAGQRGSSDRTRPPCSRSWRRPGLPRCVERGEATTAELTGARPPPRPEDHARARQVARRRRSASRRRSSSTSRWTAGSAAAARAAPGSPASSAGARSSAGFPTGSPRCLSTTPGRSSSGGGFGRSARAPCDDIKWWTGWTVAATKQALAAVDAVEVDLDGGAFGYVLPEDLEASEPPEPWIALLPALDATTMGWKVRDWYLGPTARRCSTGTATPGRPSGSTGGSSGAGRSGRLARSRCACSRTSGSDTRRAIDREAARLAEWIGTASARSSFPTPLETELKAG